MSGPGLSLCADGTTILGGPGVVVLTRKGV